jgi:N-succinyldiaminopimelate aminotransferase
MTIRARAIAVDGSIDPRDRSIFITPYDRLKSLLRGIKASPDTIDLSPGLPNWPLPAPAVAELANTLSWETTPPLRGTPALLEALARWLDVVFALNADAVSATIIPTAGSKEGLASATATALRRSEVAGKRAVIIPDGCYHAFLGATVCANGSPSFVRLAPGETFADALRSLDADTLSRTAAIIYPFHANPHARPETAAGLRAVLELAEKFAISLIADECMLELYEGARPPSFLDIARERARFPDALIVSSSLSKRSFASALRSGCLVASIGTGADLLDTRRHVSPVLPLAVQQASALLWTDGERGDAVRRHLRNSRRIMSETCCKPFEIGSSTCGIYGWIQIDHDRLLARNAFAAGVKVMPVSLLSSASGQHAESGLRLPLHGGHDDLRRGLRRLCACVPRDRS